MTDQNSETVEQEYPYWNRVYWLVIVLTVLVITCLWLFSRRFE